MLKGQPSYRKGWMACAWEIHEAGASFVFTQMKVVEHYHSHLNADTRY